VVYVNTRAGSVNNDSKTGASSAPHLFRETLDVFRRSDKGERCCEYAVEPETWGGSGGVMGGNSLANKENGDVCTPTRSHVI